MEKLDINNILEIQEIKNLIRHKRNLITFFDELIEKVNIKINDEKPIYQVLKLQPVSESSESESEPDSDDDEINAFLEGISNR